jgi:hypothetical protein
MEDGVRMITKHTGQTRHQKPPVERRLNHKLRERFDTAMKLLKPILERSTSHDTRMYLIMERLQSTYPDLTASEIEVLMMSVLRALKKKDEVLRLVVSN